MIRKTFEGPRPEMKYFQMFTMPAAAQCHCLAVPGLCNAALAEGCVDPQPVPRHDDFDLVICRRLFASKLLHRLHYRGVFRPARHGASTSGSTCRTNHFGHGFGGHCRIAIPHIAAPN